MSYIMYMYMYMYMYVYNPYNVELNTAWTRFEDAQYTHMLSSFYIWLLFVHNGYPSLSQNSPTLYILNYTGKCRNS